MYDRFLGEDFLECPSIPVSFVGVYWVCLDLSIQEQWYWIVY